MELSESPLAFVDLEMTGLEPGRHRVVEMCIERVVGTSVQDRLESHVRPDPLPATVGNEHVHGIGRASLVDAPTFADLAPRLLDLLDGAVFVAHGAKWDAAFLNAELARIDQPWDAEHHIDTLALARRTMESDNYKLATLAGALDIDNSSHHRAGNDVRVTRALFAQLLEKLDPPVQTPRHVWERCVGRMRVVPGILDAADDAIRRGSPVAVRYRASRRGARALEFVVTDVRRDLDPPLVLGYLHHTRGRRTLRADRIVSIEPLAP